VLGPTDDAVVSVTIGAVPVPPSVDTDCGSSVVMGPSVEVTVISPTSSVVITVVSKDGPVVGSFVGMELGSISSVVSVTNVLAIFVV